MQFSLKRLIVCIACMAAALALMKWVSESPAAITGHWSVFTLFFSACAALYGAGFGALLGCFWRGLLIGFLATGSMLTAYFMLDIIY